MSSTLPPPILELIGGRDWDRPTTRDWARVLAGLPLFADVGKRQVNKIAELARVGRFPSGTVVIQQGEPGDAFHLILSGRARVLGKQRTRILRTGDYFGEMALLDGAPRSATIMADGELQTMRLARKPFLRLLHKEPSITVAMLTRLAGRVRALEKTAAD
jgi:CRP-like cAMP-binding protein